MTSLTPLSILETFWWGSLGGAGGYVLVFLLPWLQHVWESKERLQFDKWRVVVAAFIAIVYCGLGGIAALVVGDVMKPKQAILYGIAGQALLNGAAKLAQAGALQQQREANLEGTAPVAER